MNKAVRGGILAVFRTYFNKCRPEVAVDFISGVAVDWIGMDVRAKVGDSKLNGGDWKQLVTSYLADL